MIKNAEFLQNFEDEYTRNNKMTVQEKFDLADELYRLAYKSGKLTIDDSQQNLASLIKTIKVFRDSERNSI